MSQSDVVDIERIGRDAAQDVASLAAVELVDVVPDADFRDRPVYRFAFLIDENADWKLSGRVRIRLEQRLRDELAALGEVRYPILQMFSRSELSKRARA